jgi:uncharacterized protein (DUF924 family)
MNELIFNELRQSYLYKKDPLWMKNNIWFPHSSKKKNVDFEISRNWKPYLDEILDNPINGLKKWRQSSRGSLCCIILLNQICRHVYRNDKEINEKANNIAVDILDDIIYNTNWINTKYLDLDLMFVLMPYRYLDKSVENKEREKTAFNIMSSTHHLSYFIIDLSQRWFLFSEI